MDLGIAGRRALLFGASRGLGLACALQLVREGAEVTIAARGAASLAEAASDIERQTGRRVATVVADLTRAEGRAAALAACPEPDILLNNADGPAPGDFRDWTRADWIAALDALMLGPIEMIRMTVDGMIARRYGRIVNLVSRSVKIPQPELGLSNGARSGLVGFVCGLARQSVRYNVTINNLLPGLFASGAQWAHIERLAEREHRSAGELRREREAAIPAGRFGDPAELGAYFAFLCSRQASYITAQNLLIDGGSYPATY
jgi:3-oxoacyl-[acyl-carrier protein] reductase